MSFRKTLCLLAALVFGVSATAFAQVADPIGIRVRIVSPDSAGYAGIGKTIKVDVLRTKNLAPTIDSVIVALRPDTTSPGGLQSPIAAGAFSADSLGLSSTVDNNTKRFVDTLAVGAVTAGHGLGSAVDTFHFTFTVTVGDPDNSGLGSKVLPVAFVKDGTSFKKLSALNTLPMSSINGFTDKVGDQKFALVDGQRPVASSVFDSVLIDTVAAKTNFPGTTYREFKIGDQVKLHMHVHGFNAAKARIGIYEASMVGTPDSSLYTKDFSAAEVVSATNGVRDSFTLASGQFKRAGMKNNLRARVLAYLVDNAGNVSNPSSATGAAAGFSQDITYVFDTNPPAVTLVYPDSSGKRFTGRVDTTLTMRLADGSVPGTSIPLKPLKFRVDEGTSVRWAIVGTDTAMYGGSADTAAAGVAEVTTDSFSAAKGKAAGASVDLSVVAFDSVGNKTTASISGVTLDQVAPVISNLFPKSGDLVDKKINNITRHPVFRISEVADSISVRYIQVGASPPDSVTQSVSSAKLSTVGSDINVTVNDSLINNEQYSFQVFIRDLAKNVNITSLDTLAFDKNFNNPSADSFIVKANEDSVLAGQGMEFTVTAIDSKLTRQAGTQRAAVTYGKKGVLLRLDAGSQDLSGVSFWGSGVTDNKDGTATLDDVNWRVGVRSVWMKSTKTLDNITVAVEDTSTTVVDGNPTKVVNFHGNLDKLTVDAADFRKFSVVAMDNGESSSTGVQGDFQVKVTPTDWWGNPSLKAFKTATATSVDSISLLDTRLASKPDSTKRLLEQVFVNFASNMGDAQVPSGPQALGVDGATFTAVAPNRSGSDLMISVRSAYAAGDTSGVLPQSQAVGSVTLAFSPEGTAPPTTAGAPAAPKNLIVQDYKGADGKGDQGFYVMVSFPASAEHARVSQYRLYRELDVTTAVDSTGNVVTVAPVKKWVAWTAIDPVDTTIVRAIVPVTDNVATRWAVASESGKSSSEQVVAGKRVFTKESVQQMASLLGVDPNRIVSPEDLSQMFMPSADYVKSLVGDKKNVIVAALDPDVASLMGANTVPTSIRTSGDAIVSSEKTLAADAVAAKDNLPPAAVADVKVTGNTVSWTASTDDHVVGSVTYRGYAIPIAGVTKYQIMGGTSESALEPIGTVPSGSTSFTLGSVPSLIRVDALDLDNTTFGNITPVGITYKHFTDASGNPVYIVVLTGAASAYTEDFEDFIAFASAFNAQKGQSNYILQADTNQDDVINFTDFIAFASTFNHTATQVDGQPVPATKPVIQAPGVNENTQFSLSQGSDRVLAGQTVTVDVSLANAKALTGYGFVLNYDADKFQYVNAAPATKDLLKSTGGETPLFLAQADQPGQVTVANAVVNGSAVSGSGDVVSLTFKVLKEFQDQARFEIANGVVFDPKQLSNPAVVAGVLNLQSTPTEFALLQNFPNPFNPETTINYNLASSSDVTLQIYNVVGQVVKTLVAERQPAGRYQVRWNGTDDRGMSVSSGIYFYSIRAGKFEDVRKLMLLK